MTPVDLHIHTMRLVVPDDELLLALDDGGANLSLTARLTSWKLELVSETKLLEMNE